MSKRHPDDFGGGGSRYNPSGFPPDSEPAPSRGGRRRSWERILGPLTGAVGLAILLGVGVYALADSRNQSACDITKTVEVKIAVAAEIAPAMQQISKTFNSERHSQDGRCVSVSVKPADPVSMSATLAGHGSKSAADHPDAWIPDSSLWVALIGHAKGNSPVRLTSTSLAQSPLIVAAPRDYATGLRSKGVKPTWDMLFRATGALSRGEGGSGDQLPENSVHIQALDPARNAAGLGSLIMARQLLKDGPKPERMFAAITRSLHSSISPNTRTLFGTFERAPRGRAPVVMTSEQSVWAFNRTKPGKPASAIYPVEGVLNLDYPVAVTTTDPAKRQAVQQLETALAADSSRAAVHSLGFRTPDGQAGSQLGESTGTSPKAPRALPAPRTDDIQAAVQGWGKLTLDSRILALVDISGSMAEPFGTTGRTRLQGITAVAQRALQLYPDNTDIGIWSFSTKLDGPRDYRKEVPIGRIGDRAGSVSKRQAVVTALNRMQPKADGDTGLYDSIQASYRELKKGYKPDKYNYLIVFTDGADDDPGGGISLTGLLKWLRQESDDKRPISIVSIGIGAGTDDAAMKKIAKTAGGASGAFTVRDPADIQKVFLETIARRICTPKCPSN